MFRDFNNGGFLIDAENANPRRKIALIKLHKRTINGDREKTRKLKRNKIDKEKMFLCAFQNFEIQNLWNCSDHMKIWALILKSTRHHNFEFQALH